MIVYFSMIIATVCFAFFAMKSNTYSIKIANSGKIVQFNQRNIFIFLSFLPMFLVSALRYQVGVDYNSYLWIFDFIQQDLPVHAEIGYKVLNKIVGQFTNDPQYIYVVCAAITIGCFVYGIYQYSSNPPFSLFLFITMGYIFSSFNILRQYIAIALIFASLKLIKENRFWAFLPIVLVSMTFHKTAIIMIPLFFLVRLRLKQSYMTIIAMIAACFIPLRGPLTNILVKTFYPQYAGTNLIQPLSTFELLYYALVFGALVILSLQYKEQFLNDSYNLILFNCIYYSFLIYVCLSFVPEINRIAIYIEIFVILLIPRLFDTEQNIKVRRFYYILATVCFTAFFIVSIGIMERFRVVPYQWVIAR